LDVRLRIILKPKPQTRAVLEPKVGEILPVIKGNGSLNLLCGNCGAVLVEGINEGQIRNMVIHCPICRYYNDVP
jgi:DNA-directed RNA polymerase subunit RPC12/RpoP